MIRQCGSSGDQQAGMTPEFPLNASWVVVLRDLDGEYRLCTASS